jgi:hypothetical protein
MDSASFFRKFISRTNDFDGSLASSEDLAARKLQVIG